MLQSMRGSDADISQAVLCADEILAFLAPFQSDMWLCIVFSAFLVYVVWVIMARLSPLGAHTVRRMREIHTPHTSAPVREFAVGSSGA